MKTLKEAEEFMRSCDIHPHCNQSAKIETEDCEGAYLDREELIKLSEALIIYTNRVDEINGCQCKDGEYCELCANSKDLTIPVLNP